MTKITKIFISLLLFLYILGLILIIVTLFGKYVDKRYSIANIVIDLIMILYIVYRFFVNKKIFFLAIALKWCGFLFNIANFGVIIYYAKINWPLSENRIRIYLFYELIILFKFYVHVISMQRFGKIECGDIGWIRMPNKEIEDNNFNQQEQNKELNEVKNKNDLLREENQRLINEKSKISKNIFIRKKIDIICHYIKSNYNMNLSTDILFKKLLYEIKEKCGLVIDKKIYEEIAINYIKQRLSNYLLCPITCQIFSNPYITPDGQTFDKIAIMKKIQITGLNPITNKELKPEELIENKLVLDISEIMKLNYDYFTIQHFQEIKKLLKSKITNKLYEYPCVVYEGSDKGNTKEKYNFEKFEKYPNLVIKNMIKQNLEIFDDNFLKFDIQLDANFESKVNPINPIVEEYSKNIENEGNMIDKKRILPME